MEIIENNLQCEIETWDDPGDYPSNAGGGPLPSYEFVADITGTITIRLDDSDLEPYTEDNTDDEARIRAFLEDGQVGSPELDNGVTINSWKIEEIIGRTVILSVEEFEGGDRVDDGYDYEGPDHYEVDSEPDPPE